MSCEPSMNADEAAPAGVETVYPEGAALAGLDRGELAQHLSAAGAANRGAAGRRSLFSPRARNRYRLA